MKNVSADREIVVLAAFAANPDMSSETGIGWLFTKVAGNVARERGFTVVPVMNLRSAVRVEAELGRYGLHEYVKPIGIAMPSCLRFLETNPRLTRLEYLVWWWKARTVLRSLNSDNRVTLAHHVTFATEMFPTPIGALPSSTYRVWGPVGASGDISVYDIAPVTRMSKREKRVQLARDFLARRVARVFSKRVDFVYAQNESVEEIFKRMGRAVATFPNVVLTDGLWAAISDLPIPRPAKDDNSGINVLAVGHLIPRKRFEIAVAAMADDRLRSSTLTIIGAPLPGTPDYLPGLVEELGLGDRIKFAGKIPRGDVIKHMNACDVLIHPSAREGASGVVGEATAVGIPVVCFSRTGAASVLNASGSSGVQLSASEYESKALVSALLRAATMPRIRSREWTEARFEALFRRTHSDAAAHRDTKTLS